jgi:hypothetical protein
MERVNVDMDVDVDVVILVAASFHPLLYLTPPTHLNQPKQKKVVERALERCCAAAPYSIFHKRRTTL